MSQDILKQLPNGIPNPPPLPTPPIPSDAQPHRVSTPPPPRVSSPRLKIGQKKSKARANQPKLPAGLLDGTVPPINVLIVEDNIINLKLLEAFMKRLKVRWHTAMNGQEAVKKWRGGGFHLVLMDIQLPIMNGLEATKEIRRLERVNKIGVFSNSASSTPTFPGGAEVEEKEAKAGEEDNLMNTALFKSSVIIVALTASSLQSDRHEALAAGCNDFLTKVLSSFSLFPSFPFSPHFPSPNLHHPPNQTLTNALFPISLSTLSGSNAKSWNGAACKPSSTLTAGANGKISPSPKKTPLLPIPNNPHPNRLIPQPRPPAKYPLTPTPPKATKQVPRRAS